MQGSSVVHIISHSMGNRVTLEAFLQYNPAGMPNLGQLIFAAADMKASLFSERLAQFSTLGAYYPQLLCHSNVTECHIQMMGRHKLPIGIHPLAMRGTCCILCAVDALLFYIAMIMLSSTCELFSHIIAHQKTLSYPLLQLMVNV